MTLVLDRVEAAARAATPGRWEADAELLHYASDVRPCSNLYAPDRRIASVDAWLDEDGHENAAFIAAANPATVLALVAEIKALREGLGEIADTAQISRARHIARALLKEPGQ